MNSETITDIEMKEFVLLLAGAFTILVVVAMLTSSGFTPQIPKRGVDSPDEPREMDREWGREPVTAFRFAETIPSDRMDSSDPSLNPTESRLS